jgi:hypothetical protein
VICIRFLSVCEVYLYKERELISSTCVGYTRPANAHPVSNRGYNCGQNKLAVSSKGFKMYSSQHFFLCSG